MFIHLLKDGKVVLAARTAHTPDKDHDRFLPVSYEGDTSLVREIHIECIPKILKSDFSIAAHDHGLRMEGDYEQYIVRKSFTPPNKPSQKDLDSLGPEDIIY